MTSNRRPVSIAILITVLVCAGGLAMGSASATGSLDDGDGAALSVDAGAVGTAVPTAGPSRSTRPYYPFGGGGEWTGSPDSGEAVTTSTDDTASDEPNATPSRSRNATSNEDADRASTDNSAVTGQSTTEVESVAGTGGTTQNAAVTASNQSPVADFVFVPADPNEGEPVDFDGTASYDPDGSIVSWEWDFGDGSTDAGPIPSHVYDAGGTYTVTLTVTDDNGSTDTTARDVSVNALPKPVIEYSPTTPDVNDTVSFNGSESTDREGWIDAWEWDFGDGTTATQFVASHTYTTGGFYTVALRVTDENGATNTTTRTIAVDGEPTASFDALPSSPAVGETVSFNAATSADPGGGIVAYDWNFDDGATATGETTTHTFAAPGDYLVNLTVTDDSGATDTTAMVISVTEPPTADFDFAPAVPNEGESVSFDGSLSGDPDGSIASYHWEFGDGATGTGVAPTHTYTAPGIYDVRLTVTDDDGATDTRIRTIQVNAIPTASFDYAPSSPSAGESVAFDGSGSTDPDGSLTYQWDFGDGTTTTDEKPTHTYASGGTYTVTLTVTDDFGATDTTTQTIMVNAVPSAAFDVAPSAPNEGESVSFDASPSSDPDGPIDSYQWDFGDGTGTSGMMPTHAYATSGTYTITLTVTDGLGATDTASQTVTVNANPMASFDYSPAAPSPGEIVRLDASGSSDPDGAIADYEWDLDGDGTIETTGETVAHSFSQNGSYEVTLTLTDDDGGTNQTTRTVSVTEPAPLTGGWTASTDGRIQYASPAVDPYRVVVGGLDSTVHAFYRSNGTVDWTFERNGSLADSSPTIAGGTVYVGSGSGTLYALHAGNGTVDWTHQIDSAIVSSPTVAGGTVYVGANDGEVLALDAGDGTRTWSTDVGGPVLSTPAFEAGRLAVTTDGGAVVTLDAADGRVNWTHQTGVELGHSAPVFWLGDVYVAADEIMALNGSDGSVDWRQSYGGTAGSTPSFFVGRLYVGAANGSVAALNASTGAVQWRAQTGAAVAASPTLTSERLAVASTDGTLSLLALADGAEIAAASLGAPSRSTPAIAGDVVFVGARSGTLTALGNVTAG